MFFDSSSDSAGSSDAELSEGDTLESNMKGEVIKEGFLMKKVIPLNESVGMCGNRISFRFLKTEPKPKGQTRNFGFRGFSQNRTCLIQIVNI